MLNPATHSNSIDAALASRVWILTLCRLALVILIVLAAWWWIYSDARMTLITIPNGMVMLLLITILLTAVYQLWLRVSRKLLWQIRTQFLIDTLLITWLVWETGDLISPYITLYIFLISVAGFFLGKRDAYIVTAVCSVCFTTLSLLSAGSLIYSLSVDMPLSRAAPIIAFNNAAFIFVGLMAAALADRRRIGEDLKRSEANFADLNVLHKRILGSISSGVITTDLDFVIRAFNPAAERMTGMSAADAIGRRVTAIFADTAGPMIERCLSRVAAGEHEAVNFEARLKSMDESRSSDPPLTAACSVSPLEGNSTTAAGLIISCQDTSVFHEMEESLRRSDRLAAVGRLSAGLAHEIRNPLGSMSSAIQFLSESADPKSEDAALMGVVLRESERLDRIITDFLAFAPTRSGQSNGDAAPTTDIAASVVDCLALLRHDPRVNASHVFEFEPPDGPVMVRADEARIKQVCWNLLQNSIRAMPEGGRLCVRVLEPDPRTARIVIEDSGFGIDPADLGQIFEPFFSGSDGSGLGLSIVHRIVTDLGGEIDVESEVGVGTKFSVDLPRSR